MEITWEYTDSVHTYVISDKDAFPEKQDGLVANCFLTISVAFLHVLQSFDPQAFY